MASSPHRNAFSAVSEWFQSRAEAVCNQVWNAKRAAVLTGRCPLTEADFA